MNCEADPSRKKILIVDDNEIILQAVLRKLERAGYQVFAAVDGGEAADIALRENVDAIVVDVNFAPDVYGRAWDGFQIMERLAELNATPQIRFIAVSGGEDDADRERAQKIGVATFFRKPLEHPDLVNVIRETLLAVPA